MLLADPVLPCDNVRGEALMHQALLCLVIMYETLMHQTLHCLVIMYEALVHLFLNWHPFGSDPTRVRLAMVRDPKMNSQESLARGAQV